MQGATIISPVDWLINPGAGTSLSEAIEQGLPADVLVSFKNKLHLSTEEAAQLLRISPRTLARRVKEGRLGASESDMLYRFARLYEQAVHVLENEDDTLYWLKAPQPGLGGAIPLTHARTEPGARAVEELLDRIEYGVLV